jgi:hypothetical protein
MNIIKNLMGTPKSQKASPTPSKKEKYWVPNCMLSYFINCMKISFKNIFTVTFGVGL